MCQKCDKFFEKFDGKDGTIEKVNDLNDEAIDRLKEYYEGYVGNRVININLDAIAEQYEHLVQEATLQALAAGDMAKIAEEQRQILRESLLVAMFSTEKFIEAGLWEFWACDDDLNTKLKCGHTVREHVAMDKAHQN